MKLTALPTSTGNNSLAKDLPLLLLHLKVVTEGKFPTNSGSIHYLHRSGTTPLFVFLCGLGGDSTAWQATFASLPTHYSLLAIDVPGFGFSYRPTHLGDYAISRIAQTLHPLISSFTTTPYILVGHCYGGFVARQLATLYPSDIRSLFTFSTAVQFPLVYSLLLLNPIMLAIILFFRLPLFSSIPNQNRRFVIDAHTRDIDLPRLTTDIFQTSLYSYFPSLLSAFLFRPQPIDRTIRFFSYYGSRDTINPRHQPARMARLYPHCQISIYSGGHVIPLSDPSYIAQALINNSQF